MTASGKSDKAFYICEINGCKDIYQNMNSGYLFVVVVWFLYAFLKYFLNVLWWACIIIKNISEQLRFVKSWVSTVYGRGFQIETKAPIAQFPDGKSVKLRVSSTSWLVPQLEPFTFCTASRHCTTRNRKSGSCWEHAGTERQEWHLTSGRWPSWLPRDLDIPSSTLNIT